MVASYTPRSNDCSAMPRDVIHRAKENHQTSCLFPKQKVASSPVGPICPVSDSGPGEVLNCLQLGATRDRLVVHQMDPVQSCPARVC